MKIKHIREFTIIYTDTNVYINNRLTNLEYTLTFSRYEYHIDFELLSDNQLYDFVINLLNLCRRKDK